MSRSDGAAISVTILLRLMGYLKRHVPASIGVYVSLAVLTAVNLAVPVLMKNIVDRGILHGDYQFVEGMVLLIVGITLAKNLFTFLQGYLLEVVSQGIAFDLRNELYEHLQNMSFSYYDQAQTGQLMTRATSDVDQLRFFMGRGLLMGVTTVVMLVFIAVMLIRLEPLLAVLSLITVPALIWVSIRFGTIIQPVFTKIQQQFASVTTVLQENLAGIRVVKAFTREPYEIAKFDRENDQLFEINVTVTKLFAAFMPVMGLVAGIGTIIVLWYGGQLVIDGRMSLGTLVAFNTYLGLLVMPVSMVGWVIQSQARAIASGRRVFEILDVQSDVQERAGALTLPPLRGEVEFDHVGFHYLANEPVLQDVSFTAAPGEVIALLGATGSGKSTIINLLPRFYDVTAGRILVDGHDVRDMTIESLRRQIGIVLQETTLFSGSIRENITYGVPDATDERVVAAATAAVAHDFIGAFPEGYDTPVGERGVTLSGGQKQRIAIARALLMDPRVLILDDSTSSVDADTESQIQEALAVLMKGRTTFVIAQRLTTIRDATQILVLEGGRIAARGTHLELLRESELYAQIYDLQLATQETGRGGDEARGRVGEGATVHKNEPASRVVPSAPARPLASSPPRPIPPSAERPG